MTGDSKRVRATGRGAPVDDPRSPAPTHERLPDGQHADHWVLSEEERAKGFVRPVRKTYRHVGPPGPVQEQLDRVEKGGCGGVTTMGKALAETIARDPSFYGATFCANCGDYFAIGEAGEFVWDDDGTRMGT